MSHVFTKRANPYNLRNFQTLYSLNKRAAKSGIETVTYRGRHIWNVNKKFRTGKTKHIHVRYVKSIFNKCNLSE